MHPLMLDHSARSPTFQIMALHSTRLSPYKFSSHPTYPSSHAWPFLCYVMILSPKCQLVMLEWL